MQHVARGCPPLALPADRVLAQKSFESRRASVPEAVAVFSPLSLAPREPRRRKMEPRLPDVTLI